MRSGGGFWEEDTEDATKGRRRGMRAMRATYFHLRSAIDVEALNFLK